MRGFLRTVKLIFCIVLGDYTGFGLVIGIIEHSQLATAINYSAIAISHTL
jgi:hypothetical protein